MDTFTTFPASSMGCRDATKQIFTYAKNMDFSDVAPSDLPEPLKSEPNVRELVKKQLKTYIGDSQLGSLVDVDSIDVDTLCNEMVEQASYKITDISATYNSCTVTVTTKILTFTVYRKRFTMRSNQRLPMELPPYGHPLRILFLLF